MRRHGTIWDDLGLSTPALGKETTNLMTEQRRPKELDTDDEMPRPRIVHAFSAGGVVFRLPTDLPLAEVNAETASIHGSVLASVEVVLVGYRRDDTWTLPKGTPKDGETVEETALREVREETGIQARIVSELNEKWGRASSCTNCGKCVQACPTGALAEKGWAVGEMTKTLTSVTSLAQKRGAEV